MSHSVEGARGHKTRGGEGGTSKKGVAHVHPAEGRRSLRVFGELVTCKVTSDQTGGAYSLFEVTTQPGEGRRPTSTTVRTSPSTCSRGSTNSLAARGSSGQAQAPSSASPGAPCTPTRTWARTWAVCWQPRRRGACTSASSMR